MSLILSTSGKPVAIDLFCGLGGWTEGLLAEGWEVFGFDVEAHDYGTGGYPGKLILQDVTTLHGSELAAASLIVASPPCQAYSYRAMPWSRAKVLPPPDNTLFDSCFRLQREASAAAGRYIPLVVENVRGAQKLVGRAAWNYGSYYLWGDVPAIMPFTTRAIKTSGLLNVRDGHAHTRHLTNQREHDHVKQSGICGPRKNGKGDSWFQDGAARHGSKSQSRKAASALIAKIPLSLAQHIARVYWPLERAA